MQQTFKLGKKAPIDKKSLCFEDYLTTIPEHPLVDFAPNYVYPMDLNDQYGDCVIAGWDHFNQVIKGLLTGVQSNFTEDQLIAFYKTQNPNFPQEDNGMNIQTFLEYLAAQKYIVGFAKVNYNNPEQLKAAIYLGLGVLTGVQLQNAQMDQFNSGTWDYVPGGSIDGGHCVPAFGYNNQPNIYDIVTWAKLIAMTDNMRAHLMDEAWFILMQEHIDHPDFRNHFDLTAFSQAVSQITDGKIQVPLPTVITERTLSLQNPYMTGADVKELQTLLGITADGVFGPITKKIVVAFQQSHGLVADGIVGPLTWAALKKKA